MATSPSAFSEVVTKHDGKKEKVSERSGSDKKDKVMVDIGVYVGKRLRTSPPTPWPLRLRIQGQLQHAHLRDEMA